MKKKLIHEKSWRRKSQKRSSRRTGGAGGGLGFGSVMQEVKQIKDEKEYRRAGE